MFSKKTKADDGFTFHEQTSLDPPRSPKLPKLIALIVAAVLVLAVLVSAFVMSSPLVLLGRGARNSMKALEKNEIITLFNRVTNGGSVDVSADLGTLSEALAGYTMVEGTASAKIYTDFNNSKIAVAAKVDADMLDEIDATLFLSDESVAVASDWLLGADSYGVALEDFAARFEDSEFGPQGDFSLGTDLADMVDGASFDPQQLQQDSNALVKESGTALVKSLMRNAKPVKERSTVTLNDKNVKTTAVIFELGPEEVKAICADMIEYARESSTLKDFLRSYAEYYFYLEGSFYPDPEEVEDFVDEFYEMLFDLRDDLDDFAEELEDSGFELTLAFHVARSGKQLIGVEAQCDIFDNNVKTSLCAGPDLQSAEEVRFSYRDDYENVRATYLVDSNSKNEFDSSLQLRYDNETVFRTKISWDKSFGDFLLMIIEPYGTYAVDGSLEHSDKATRLYVEDLNIDGDEFALDTSLVLTASDKMPATPDFIDVLEMRSGEIEDLMNELLLFAEELTGGYLY